MEISLFIRKVLYWPICKNVAYFCIIKWSCLNPVCSTIFSNPANKKYKRKSEEEKRSLKKGHQLLISLKLTIPLRILTLILGPLKTFSLFLSMTLLLLAASVHIVRTLCQSLDWLVGWLVG